MTKAVDDTITTSANLSDLHQLYDGIIPKAVLDVARYGSPEMVALIRANGEVALFRSMVRGQIKTIRARRADGTYYPALIDDLRLYRRQHRAWHALAVALRRKIDGKAPAIAPARRAA